MSNAKQNLVKWKGDTGYLFWHLLLPSFISSYMNIKDFGLEHRVLFSSNDLIQTESYSFCVAQFSTTMRKPKYLPNFIFTFFKFTLLIRKINTTEYLNNCSACFCSWKCCIFSILWWRHCKFFKWMIGWLLIFLYRILSWAQILWWCPNSTLYKFVSSCEWSACVYFTSYPV